MRLNADFSTRAYVAATEPFVASPMPGVERRMLDRVGDEVARATSIVRYAPDSRFSAHVHTGGEEFLVLEGVFQDEHGDFPAGTYVRNPIGTRHAPASASGCTIFVKLSQFSADEQQIRRVDTEELRYRPDRECAGVEAADLFKDADEHVRIEIWQPDSDVVLDASGGLEVLVLDGGFEYEGRTVGRHDWLRLPSGDRLRVGVSPGGARVWTKRGHLGAAPMSRMHSATNP
ncbi:MAG: cupin domain-containing protein [Pseudomonadota bacterium]